MRAIFKMRAAAVGGTAAAVALGLTAAAVGLAVGVGSGSPESSSVQKQEFVEAADRICRTAEARAERLRSSGMGLTAMIEHAVADSESELRALGALAVPPGDEVELNRLFNALQSIVYVARDAARLARAGETPRLRVALEEMLERGHRAGALARAYGLLECANSSDTH